MECNGSKNSIALLKGWFSQSKSLGLGMKASREPKLDASLLSPKESKSFFFTIFFLFFKFTSAFFNAGLLGQPCKSCFLIGFGLVIEEGLKVTSITDTFWHLVCGAGGGPTLFKVQNLDLLEPHLNLDLLAFKRLSKKLGWSMRLDLRTETPWDGSAVCKYFRFFRSKGIIAVSKS